MEGIRINFSKKLGPFKPVNGIDNGPVCFGSLIDSSVWYKQAAFPYCRLHDTNYPHPREVDVPAIFPDFEADETDPASYSFAATDQYLLEIAATGARVIYRLGVSIEHTKHKLYVAPPKDPEKWARVCLQIARHYNEGWAGGFSMGIEYWEVWNEPDQLTPDRVRDPMWSGSREEYFSLYAATSRLFKREMPSVKIGGYAACGMLAPNRFDYFLAFLGHVREHALPLDFFSFHTYTDRLSDIRENARIAREELDRHGFSSAEIVLDEWNYLAGVPDLWGRLFSASDGSVRREVFLESASEIGASFTAAALIDMLDLPIDIATFYDGHPTNLFCTIFDRFGLPTKQYRAFEAFGKLARCGERAESACLTDGLYAAAAASDGEAFVLAVNLDARSGVYPLEIEGLPSPEAWRREVLLLDARHDLEAVGEAAGAPPALLLRHNSFALVRYTKE